MEEERENNSINSLPVDLQLGDSIFKRDLYVENYIVRMEIYKPKGKNRRPTNKTINRIFYMLGQMRVFTKEEAVQEFGISYLDTKQD
jgi:hypothetical protein